MHIVTPPGGGSGNLPRSPLGCTTRLSMQPVSSAGDRQGSKECHIAAPPIREDAPQLTASPYHYGLMPANFTTSAHFSVSSAINAPNSVGVIGIGSALRPLIRALTCGSARPAAILLLSLSMIAAGVAPRRPIPLHTPPPRPPRKY